MERLIEDKEYQLFISTHYEFREEISLVPLWSNDTISFPRTIRIRKKRLSLLDKIKFYIQDFIIWMREERY